MLNVVVIVMVEATPWFEERVLVVVLGEGDFLLTGLEELAKVVKVSLDAFLVCDGGLEDTDLVGVFCERGLGIVDLRLEVNKERLVWRVAGGTSWRKREGIVLGLIETRSGRGKEQEYDQDTRYFLQRPDAFLPWRR